MFKLIPALLHLSEHASRNLTLFRKKYENENQNINNERFDYYKIIINTIP